MSVTKSITSLLIGIAIDKGYIKSVNDFMFVIMQRYNRNRIYRLKSRL